MIVNRGYATVARGQVNAVVAFIKEVMKDREETVRIYTPQIGENDVVCFEIEFESLADYEIWNRDNVDNPTSQEELKPWFSLTRRFRNEILRVETM